MTLLALARSVTNRRAAGSRLISFSFEFRNLQSSLLAIVGSCGEAICVICVICGLIKIRVHSLFLKDNLRRVVRMAF